MEIDIIAFGKIAELIEAQRITLSNIEDTDGLKMELETLFSPLASMKYKLALNKNIVQHNLPITHNDSIAIMPPFSGG